MKPVEYSSTATPEQIWQVLSNGWLFGSWVVGASRVRAVEEGWPRVGTRIHHSVGAWPAVIDDNTVVLEAEEPRRLVLQARLRPVGEARVEITLEPRGAGTLLRIKEDFVRGPATVLPEPVRQVGLRVRNVESLHRLALLAERRSRPEN